MTKNTASDNIVFSSDFALLEVYAITLSVYDKCTSVITACLW
jgi:hypothetical protein